MSKEMGGGEKLREGFERVRNEMEGAAREMRRERQATASTSGSGSSDDKGKDTRPVSEVDIDWSFWGAVVQDYEQVAVSRPKDLSKAIQHGIPPVIRSAPAPLISRPSWQIEEQSGSSCLLQKIYHLKNHIKPYWKSHHLMRKLFRKI
jgi:ribosomal protein S15P/S13E